MSTPTSGDHIAVRLSDTDAERFRLACAVEGRTISSVLRDLTRAYWRSVVQNDDDPESGNPRAVQAPDKEAPHAAAPV